MAMGGAWPWAKNNGHSAVIPAGDMATAAKAEAKPKAKPRDADAVVVNAARSALNTFTNGIVKNVPGNTKDQATQALDMLKTLCKTEKADFARKVLESKKNKDFNWVRSYRETLNQKTISKEAATENYYTRIM